MKNCQKIKNAAAKIWGKFRIKKKVPPIRTLVSIEYGFYCAVARINRKSGGIGYRIIPDAKYGAWDILITLDSLARLGALPGTSNTKNGNSPNQKKYRHQTHRFGFFRCGSDGRIIPWCVFDVDLCGDKDPDSWFVKNASEKIIEAVAHKALFIGHRPRKTIYMTWQGQIERMNWVGLIEEESRWYLADEFHELNEVEIYNDKLRNFAG